LTRQRLPPVTHTDALFANQSQSILDDLVALLGQSSPGIARTQNAVICDTRRPATWCLGKTRTRCNDAQARRTDPRSRQFGTFIQKEICQPLDLDSLWVGIPDAVEARVATLTNMPPIPPGAPGVAPGALSPLAIPPQVGTTQEVFGRADVRRACLPGASGIMN